MMNFAQMIFIIKLKKVKILSRGHLDVLNVECSSYQHLIWTEVLFLTLVPAGGTLVCKSALLARLSWSVWPRLDATDKFVTILPDLG